jgi:hypothetical protein
VELESTKSAIEEYGLDLMSELIAAMRQEGSRHLLDELSQETREDVNSIESIIKGPNAVYFFSEGRAAGRFPPLDDIRAWLADNNMDVSLAFPISRKIATSGTKLSASHFLDKFRLMSENNEKVLSAYAQDVSTDIKKAFYSNTSL